MAGTIDPQSRLPGTQGKAPAPRLVLLGAPCVVRDATRVALSAKDAALLALVALAGPIRSERVAALLWPSATAKQADASLRQRLHRLRRQAGVSVSSSNGTLQVAADLDLDAVVAAIDGDAEPGDHDELLGDLRYDDLPELAAWVSEQRRRWRERRDTVLAAAADRCEAAGAIDGALRHGARLAGLDPLGEHAQRRLMRLHYLRGDRAAAIAAFERFEQRLRDELGARPSAETVALLATIESGEAAAPRRREGVPAALLRPPRLVGRAREMETLAQAWTKRRVALVVGEAGIGKTRLLQEFVAGRDGVVAVQARPGDAGIAYALLGRLLRAVLAAPATGRPAPPDAAVPGLAAVATPTAPRLDPPRAQALALVLPELGPAAVLAGEAQRLLLQRAVQATLAEAGAGGLQALVVDDLHFADDASVACLQSLIESNALAGIRWALAQRPAEARTPAARLRAALEEDGRVEPCVVAPLDVGALTALVESLGLAELDAARLGPALRRHTGGNPMFALETLKDLLLSGDPAAIDERLPQPVSVAALVERRLAQLSAEALRLARVAALAGPDFSAALAVAVLDAHPLDLAEPWRELETAQVIRDAAFAHDLVFEATRASVPAPIARLLHGRIAAHLVAQGALPDRLAPHWAGAAEWARAGEAYAAAAWRAQRASQRSHEVECWRLAAESLDRAGLTEAAFDARCESVDALIIVQGVTEAGRVIEALLGAARGDRQRVAALVAKAKAALMAADHANGIAAASEAAERARGFESPWPGFAAARLLAVGLAQAGRGAEALGAIEPYREPVEQAGSTEQRAGFWSDFAYVLNASRRLRETAFALRKAIVQAEALGDIAELATLTSNLATVQGNLGQVPEALSLAHRSLALQERLGGTDGPEGAVVRTYVGLYSAMSGRYAEALQKFDEALACFVRDGQVVWIAVCSNHKAQLLIDLGQLARARQALAYEAPAIGHIRARGATVAARLERALGHSGRAEVERAMAELAPGADPHVRMQVLLERAIGEDDPRAAARAFDEVAEMAASLEFVGVALKARLLGAHALSRAGDTASAALAMREPVARLAAVQPSDLYMGLAWWLAAQVFEASGDGDQALLALARGAEWVRRVALPNVPAEFRESFLARNPSNRALLAAADRRLSSPR
ncbi:MAG: AAA family ATPase [Caldimonas sp.]